jgi:dCTP deaminase
MIINQQSLLKLAPIENMFRSKQQEFGVSHGLSEVGYDIRIKQDIVFTLNERGEASVLASDGPHNDARKGRFILASTIEKFDMPDCLAGVVHDKSTWARRGLSVFNTVIEPGWKGYLTLELVFHGQEDIFIPAGSGIAQVIFTEIRHPYAYEGKYQDQANAPVPAKEA